MTWLKNQSHLSSLLVDSPITLNARTSKQGSQKNRLKTWKAGVDSRSASLVISLGLAEQLGLVVREMNLVFRTAAREGQPLPAKGFANLSFDLEDSAGQWHQYCEQVVVADIDEDMLLGMPWLNRHRPRIEFGPARLFHTRWREDPVARIQPVSLEDLVEDGKPIYVASVTVADDLLIADIQLQIPEAYRDLAEAFSPNKAWELPPHREDDLAIDIEPGAQLSLRPIYKMSELEKEALREYIWECLTYGFIRPSKAAIGTSVLFAPKKDGGLRVCIDYRELNLKSLKIRYPLPLIDDLIHQFAGAKIFTKLDLKNAYHRIRIREGDEWKTTFRTHLGAFEYLVVPLGLTNAPSAFQSYINKTLREYLDVFVVVYLDDMVIYSAREEDHEEHVRKVLEALIEAGLYCKLSKCVFGVREIDFLGYIVNTDGVAMEKSRVSTIQDWPEPQSIHEIQVFLGFANFYRRFIRRYSKLAAGLSDMLKGQQNLKGKRRRLAKLGAKISGEFLTDQARKSFKQLRAAFSEMVILAHFEPGLQIRLETDASGFAISGVLSQLAEDGSWRPIAFYSRKMNKHELNYGVHDQELLAIVESFREWRHFCEGSKFPIAVRTDHDSLRYFENAKDLSRRQVRWAQRLSAFWFRVEYQKGSQNPADGPSRRPDYQKQVEKEDNSRELAANDLRAMLMPNKKMDSPALSSLKTVEANDDEAQQEAGASIASRIRARRNEHLAKVITNGTYRDERSEYEIREAPNLTRDETPWSGTVPQGGPGALPALLNGLPKLLEQDEVAEIVREGLRKDPSKFAGWVDKRGVLWHDGLLYIPANESLRIELIRKHHDVPLAGHLASVRTLELLARKYYWNGMHKMVREYCAACGVCQGSRVIRQKPQGQLQPLPIPANPWEQISMDFVTDLPASISFEGVEHDALLVVVDRFTKMGHFIPTWKDITTEQLAELFVREVVRLHGLPTNIVTDRGSVFASEFWTDLLYLLMVSRNMSTAYHPQSDGQTERLNSVLEQYLRSFINFDQDDWVKWVPLAEFAYNNSRHSSSHDTPFRLLYGIDPRMDFSMEGINGAEDPKARETTLALETRRDKAREALEQAQAYQKAYYDSKHKPVSFREDDLVWLDLRNITTARPSKKLDLRRYGPCKVIQKIGSQAYRLELPAGLQVHNVFHVSLLRKHSAREGVDSTAHHPIREAPEELRKYQVQSIVDSMKDGRKIFYRVQWQGYGEDDDTWEPIANVRHLRKKLHEFHKANPGKPGIREFTRVGL